VWDAATGQQTLTLQGHTLPVRSVAFSSDGKTLWSRDGSGTVKAWDLDSGKELSHPGSPPRFAQAGDLHPSLPLLALPQGNTVCLIDLSPPDADELAYRESKARFDPFWHKERAEESEQAKAWFAAAFHRAQLAEHSPWDAETWEKLDEVCRQLSDNRPARSVCDRLLQHDPALAPIYLQRARIRLGSDDAWGAGADLLRCTLFTMRDHPDWDQFGDAAAWQGNAAAAKDNWQRAGAQYTLASYWRPRYPWALHALAWARLAAGDEEGCRSVCRLLRARFGTLEGNRNILTLSVLLGQGLQPLAPGLLLADRVVQQDAAKRANAIVYTACLLPAAGIDADSLVTLAARAAAIDPASADHQEAYGAALYRAGRYAEAVKALEEAVRLTGNDGSNWQNLFLAMAYHKLGQADKSRARFDKAKLDLKAGWEYRLVYRRLRQEAEKLRQPAAKPGP
jgi:tetratricopeptide (TPR) repeat protein